MSNTQHPTNTPHDPLAEQVAQILHLARSSLSNTGTTKTNITNISKTQTNTTHSPPETQQHFHSSTDTVDPANPADLPLDADYSNLPYWYPPNINSETFSLNTYLTSIPNIKTLLNSTEGRKALTFADPIMFALTYLPHHLKDQNRPTAPPSFADCHFNWARRALTWAANRNRTTPIAPQEDRHAEIAPRACGKSTWWFLIIPLWAAAHKHKRFIAAFASTATQAEGHLQTFKNEIDNNKYLKKDFPELTNPKRRPTGAAVADRSDTFQALSGFVFIAKGVDSSNLGMKVEEERPDLLLLDDVEPDEASYSSDLAKKRLKTIQDAILQLNIYASVTFVGTVTMPNSIIHQIVKFTHGDRADHLSWIRDENIIGHHYLPIVRNVSNGDERSLWPEKWSLTYLKSIAHTRSYAKNYANDPKGRDGDYWNDEDFTRQPFTPRNNTRTAIFLDPATTTHRKSDPAGIAVVSWNPPTPQQLAQPFEMAAPRPITERGTQRQRATNKTIRTHPGTVAVRHSEQTKKTGRALARHIYNIIASNPHLNIRRLIVEATQGGDLWLEVFEDCPVMVEIINPKEGKEVRFARALEYYQKEPTLVTHDAHPDKVNPHIVLEEQMLSFPKGAHDDVADAAVSGTLYFLEPRPKKQKVRTRVRSYV